MNAAHCVLRCVVRLDLCNVAYRHSSYGQVYLLQTKIGTTMREFGYKSNTLCAFIVSLHMSGQVRLAVDDLVAYWTLCGNTISLNVRERGQFLKLW